MLQLKKKISLTDILFIVQCTGKTDIKQYHMPLNTICSYSDGELLDYKLYIISIPKIYIIFSFKSANISNSSSLTKHIEYECTRGKKSNYKLNTSPYIVHAVVNVMYEIISF